MFFLFFFFFKQKTAYEISVRDWSSDVCSSDLYLSKSKWMSFSSGIEANSAGAGRAVVAAGAGAGAGVDGVLGTGAAGAGVLGAGAGVAGGAAGAGADGGGAATEVVAGRFAQPAATTPSTRSSMIVR